MIKIDINFRDSKVDDRRRERGGDRPGGRGPRPDGPRGDRPGPRGPRPDGPRPAGRPARGGKGGREQAAPRVDDINDFPSLVAA